MKYLVTFALAMFLHGQFVLADDTTYVVAGLEKPAEIIVDEWGVPHIYANTHYDAFFVQGFNAARDRLWQIDIWRRRGLGQLSEILGEEYILQDRATRLFLYRGDMYREWLAYGSDAKRVAQAFTAGINAYIDLLDEHPDLLPPEFALLDYKPARWNAADVVRIRGHGLWGNVDSEVRRARIVCAADLDTATYWQQLEPEWTTEVPDGLDPCTIPANVLDTYHLAKAPVTFGSASLALNAAITDSRDRSIGSNNWVVAPSRTKTGRPILADDPHRTHAVPSLRYIAHLVAPGLNVIGAGEPALPGISIGHNDRIAFGLTIFPIDQEDLYVYEKEAGKYRYRDGLEAFTTITETVSVKGQPDVEVELKFARHGPVVHETNSHAFVVRAAWFEPGMAPYFGSVEYMRASNWREFVAALNRWGAPSENQVYADIDGNIGYKPAGLFPRRRNWDGLLPVPGDGSYEWAGFHDMDVLPVEYNPERGFTGTANSMNLPDDYPINEYRAGFEWNAGWRYDRLWQVLEKQDAHTLDDSNALQRDYVSLLALEAIRRIPAEVTAPAAVLLRNWDGDLAVDSAAGALYAIWYYRHLRPLLAQVLLPDDPVLVAPLGSPGVLRLMNEDRAQDAIAASLTSAYAEIVHALGDDPENWRWGDLHKIHFEHPLLQLADADLAAQMTYPAYPRGGSGNTTNNTGFSPNDLLVRAGASYRQVIDVGNWDAARMTNAPGQSGDPRSPFYDNLLRGWAEEESFPLLYDREKIQQHRAFSIQLRVKTPPD
ncbi:MAG: penicillin acylase family protein [Gammaproteobacteria bacterium]|nr:MAG: penicillin acylase family protein [Gammaproteobacteria bacterium]